MQQVSHKYIEGVAEECFRQGLSAEEAAVVFDLAMTKEAGFISRGWEAFKNAIGFGDNPEQEFYWDEKDNPSKRMQKERAGAQASYEEFQRRLDAERRNNMYDIDGERRDKPLYTEQEMRERAARGMSHARIPTSLHRDRSATEAQIKSVQAKLDALAPEDTGSRQNLERELKFWKERAYKQGEKYDKAQRDLWAGYGMRDRNAPSDVYAKQREKSLKYNNRIAAEYDAARKAKDKWGWFSFLHPDTWFAPSEFEMQNAQRQINEYNDSDSWRKRMMYALGPEGIAKTTDDMQQMGWENVTGDGYTGNEAFRKEHVRQNKGLEKLHNQQQQAQQPVQKPWRIHNI